MRLAVARPAAAPLTRAPAGLVLRRCACGGTPGPDGECAACKRKRLLRLAHGPAPAAPPPLVDAVVRSPGRPLDAAARAAMETRFGAYRPAAGPPPAVAASSAVSSPGDAVEREAERVAAEVAAPRAAAGPAASRADFSRVRVHTDARAAASARAVDAHAYTVGSHIVFDRGRYAPATAGGQRLLAHELAHVVQLGGAQRGPVLRQASCVHDGPSAGCGWAWRFEGQRRAVGVDRLIVDSLGANLPGTWVPEIASPLNTLKNATERGRVDALKVEERPGELHLDVIEIKSRATGQNGGCTLASREADEYVRVYTRIAPRIVQVSRAAEQLGGLAADSASKLTVGQTRVLQGLGVDPADPNTRDALRFWFSLQNKLGRTFVTAFANVTFAVSADGTRGADYTAIKVRKDCATKKGVREGTIELLFQVNELGGISYRCKSECPDDERKRRRPQPELQPRQRKDVRPRVEVQESEPTADQPGVDLPDQPPAEAPTPDQPTEGPGGDRPEIRDQPAPKPDVRKQPPARPDVRTQPQQTPTDQPAPEPGLQPSHVPELVVSLAVLHQIAKQARARALEGAISSTELASIEATLEKQAIEVVDQIGKEAPELARKLDGHNVEKLATEAYDDIVKVGAKEADDIALKVAARSGTRVALKAASRVVVVLAVVMTARDVYAAVNHLRKGGEIRIGLGGDDVELAGDTKVTKRNEDPFNKPNVRGDVHLKDTTIDIDMKGIPSISGRTEIDAENVTIRQAGMLSNGDPITVNIHAKLKNTTVTITHRARFKDGKAVIGGEAVDMSDTSIEIDLPPDVALPERQRKPGEPVSLKGVKMKITEVPATPTPGAPQGQGGAGQQQGRTAPAPEQKPVDKPGEKPAAKPDPAAKYKDLDEPTKQKIRQAGKPVQALFDELTKPDPKVKGIPVTNETIRRFYDTVPGDLTDAQAAALRKRLAPLTTDDEEAWFGALQDAVDAVRKPDDATLKQEGQGPKDKPAPQPEQKKKPDDEKPTATPREIFEQNKEIYERLKPGQFVIDWSAAQKEADRRRKKGDKVSDVRHAVYLGKTDDRVELTGRSTSSSWSTRRRARR